MLLRTKFIKFKINCKALIWKHKMMPDNLGDDPDDDPDGGLVED